MPHRSYVEPPQGLAAPPRQHRCEPSRQANRIRNPRPLLSGVKRDDVINEHLLRRLRTVLRPSSGLALAQVFGEERLSFSKALWAAACADALRAVSDEVDGSDRTASPSVDTSGSQIEADAFCWSTHVRNSKSARSAAGVTKRRPATFAARRWPFRISLRNEDSVRGPSGKKTATASGKVSGSSSAQSRGYGRDWLRPGRSDRRAR